MSNLPTPIVALPVSQPARSDTPSFLDLPAEIRNSVYDFLFKFDTELRLKCCGRPDISQAAAAPVQGIALLSTCRQIHEEATTILYSQNTFAMGDTLEHGYLFSIQRR